MRKSHWQQRKTAGYETRGCDTPGRFAMDERDGNFRGAMSTFQNRRRRENNGKTKIRIRLKAYEHRILDQSADKIVETAKELELAYLVQFHCQLNAACTRSSVRHTNTKIHANNSKCVHTNV